MSDELQRPAAVLFDWDGTLVDSFALLHAAHNYARAELGLPSFSLETFGQYFGQPREKLYVELYGEHKETAKKHFETYVFENHLTGITPLPGTGELLKQLHVMQIPCGIVSNKRRTFIVAEVENLGWAPYFQTIVGAGDAGADKPSPDPIILAGSQITPEAPMKQTWFIGDTDNDLLAAEGAGCISVLIAGQPEAADLLAKYKVHLHKNNCNELHEFLLQYG